MTTLQHNVSLKMRFRSVGFAMLQYMCTHLLNSTMDLDILEF